MGSARSSQGFALMAMTSCRLPLNHVNGAALTPSAPIRSGINTTSAALCCAACFNTTGCTYFTFVSSRQLCWLKEDGLGGSSNDNDCISGSRPTPPPTPCTADVDCNYAGTCTGGQCHCDPPFFGPSCASFKLYSFKPGEGGLMISTGNTSWGGSVVEADGESARFSVSQSCVCGKCRSACVTGHCTTG